MKFIILTLILSTLSFSEEHKDENTLHIENFISRKSWSHSKDARGLSKESIKDDGTMNCYDYVNGPSAKVIKTRRSHSRLENLKAIYKGQRIIVHHTAAHESFKSSKSAVINVAKMHKYTNKWLDIGYHFLIGKDGKVYEGRPLELMGGHAGSSTLSNVRCEKDSNHNKTFELDPSLDMDYRSIGVALIGNYQHKMPPKTQLNALSDLIETLKSKLGIATISSHTIEKNVKVVHGRKDHCPGKFVMKYLNFNHFHDFDPVNSFYTTTPNLRFHLAKILSRKRVNCKIKCIKYSKRY